MKRSNRNKSSVWTKSIALLLALGMNGVGLFSVGHTQGLYVDTELTTNNYLEAGRLNIALSITEFDGVLSNEAGDESEFQTTVSLVSGSLDTQYEVTYEKTGGTIGVCNAIDLEAVHSALSYSGAIENFTVGTTTVFGLWDFTGTVGVSDSIPVGQTCEFDLIFTAWADEQPDTTGFVDEERLSVTIEGIGVPKPIVLNEFLPNPDGILCTDGTDDCDEDDPEFIFDFGKDSSDMPQGEWVELYNLSTTSFSVLGWSITDASGGVGNTDILPTNTVPATTTIPGLGYLVVYMNKPVWNNTGDTLFLYDENDVLVDSYAYSSDYDYCELVPTPGGTNDETPSGAGIDCTPGKTIQKNKSYARIPDGTGGFIDPIPTPNAANTLDEVSRATIENGLEGRDIEQTVDNDTEAPLIHVMGNNPAVVSLGQQYSDLGATVTDNVQRIVGIKVFGTADIDTKVVGEYQVRYEATDQSGNTGEAVRYVVVYDPNDGEPDLSKYESLVTTEETEEVEVIESEVVEEEQTEEENETNEEVKEEDNEEKKEEGNEESKTEDEGEAEDSDAEEVVDTGMGTSSPAVIDGIDVSSTTPYVLDLSDALASTSSPLVLDLTGATTSIDTASTTGEHVLDLTHVGTDVQESDEEIESSVSGGSEYKIEETVEEIETEEILLDDDPGQIL